MRQESYLALVQTLVGMFDIGSQRERDMLNGALAQHGVQPETWAPTEEFLEQATILGMVHAEFDDMVDLQREYGMDNPGAIDHMAWAKTPRRMLILLQEHRDNQPVVSLYVYVLHDPGLSSPINCWTCAPLVVQAAI